MKPNRTKTGEWDGQTISRPKTLGERHPDMFKKKDISADRAKVSKAEILAKFKARQVEKHGGVEKFQGHLQAQRNSIGKALSKHKAPSESEKSDYQRRTGRGYSE